MRSVIIRTIMLVISDDCRPQSTRTKFERNRVKGQLYQESNRTNLNFKFYVKIMRKNGDN